MPFNQWRLGTTLIWIGVSAWLPFFYFLSMDRPVSIFPYLAAHLTGVLGGSWLRARYARAAGLEPPRHGGKRRIVARVMIYLGVLAWAPYFYLTRVTGLDLEIGPFLTAHLIGVLGGSAVRLSIEFDRFFNRREPAAE